MLVRRLTSFRGELEVTVDQPDHVWRYAAGAPLLPLPVADAMWASRWRGGW